MKILVTGGTVFVSRYVAEYFSKENEVYVLNRGTRRQSEGVIPIIADRHNLGDKLKEYKFDAVIDVCGYNEEDVRDLHNALGEYGVYVFISSSAVYPETTPLPFKEEFPTGENAIWGSYGLNKVKAENYLGENCPDAYILRPPYLYGKMNNLYRESFAFECAERDMPFYVPDSEMKLQFFDVEDLCRFMKILKKKRPSQRVFNVGNSECVSIADWATLCYKVLGKKPIIHKVDMNIGQRNYFPFYNYDYKLDVSKMLELMPDTKPLEIGLKQSYEWFSYNRNGVNIKNYFEFIEKELRV